METEDFDPIEAKSFSSPWGKWLKRKTTNLQLYDLIHARANDQLERKFLQD